jgi:hypothetical protein
MNGFKSYIALFIIAAFIALPTYALAGNACNPCATNPCAANPCGGNPCAANPCGGNPCAANPCGGNPCAANPCGAKMKVKPIRTEKIMSLKDAVNLGEKLWKDTTLGSSGLSCNTCHADGKTYNKTALRPYPHYVGMPNDIVTLDQMINFCMINPMKADPLPYGSKEMTALSAYLQNVSLKEIKGAMGNPCAAKNACNPCNPCAGKNPCNPCNPCGAR